MKYGAVVGSIITGVPFYLLCIYKRTRLGIFDKLSGEWLKDFGSVVFHFSAMIKSYRWNVMFMLSCVLDIIFILFLTHCPLR